MDLITFAIVVASMEFVVGLALLVSPVRAIDRVWELLDNPGLLSVIMFFLSSQYPRCYETVS
jgi:hypothetical protein